MNLEHIIAIILLQESLFPPHLQWFGMMRITISKLRFILVQMDYGIPVLYKRLLNQVIKMNVIVLRNCHIKLLIITCL